MSAALLNKVMQEMEIDAASIENPNVRTLQYVLITLYFLQKYPVMDVIESTFDFLTGFIGRKIWEHVRKLQVMKGDIVAGQMTSKQTIPGFVPSMEPTAV